MPTDSFLIKDRKIKSMQPNKIQGIIAASGVFIRPGRYAYLKMPKKPEGNYFLIAQDNDEVTVVAEEKDAVRLKSENSVKWFRLIEFRVAKPFESTGFLAKITQTITNRKMNLLIVSTFSKDYVFVREEKVNEAVAALKKAGFSVENTQKPKVKSMFGALKGKNLKWTRADRADFHEW